MGTPGRPRRSGRQEPEANQTKPEPWGWMGGANMDKSINILKKPDSAEVHVWKINIQVNFCCSRDICGLNLFGNSLSTFLLLKKIQE